MGKPENPLAFPLQDGPVIWPGMTLRDWFAGQALAGLMANANMPFAPDYAECEPGQIGQAAYDIADAMLLARSIGEG